ncbi:MAG TPA: DUF1501 domain-containing protein [Verrucomicrobiae bacterium]|nr:DUF1501 domain-containing protein [Verrucomicrobiae bacterium]
MHNCNCKSHGNVNILTRRNFLDRSFKVGLGVALSTLVDIPLVVKRALAEGNIGVVGPNGRVKKLLFIFLRGANDSLNSVVPMLDPSYMNLSTGQSPIRPVIAIPPDGATNYTTLGAADFPVSGTGPTFGYANAIRLGNGFAALHPSLKFLAPVYNAGDLALIHRVGYPKQSRSHFDSQNYWETGSPNNNTSKDGILYRTMVESGLANAEPLTGVSIQSSLPLILRGSNAAMTNLSDPARYSLFGIPSGNTAAANKVKLALADANNLPTAEKNYRGLLNLQYKNLNDTLATFADLQDEFNETNGISYVDGAVTDNDFAYRLFPTSNALNGGYTRGGGVVDAAKYVVDTGAYGFFRNLRAASVVLNKTNAIVAGTEFGGFDTHSNQGGITGGHANLQRRIGWAIYALRQYFTQYADKASWDDLVVITLSEFGRTTVQNSDLGTDHAEAGVMFVAGGGVKGYGAGNANGVFGCSPSDTVPWISGPADQTGGIDGSMFGVSNRYLKRAYDYRSVLGKLIRDHPGATQNQLNRIIPGYTDTREKLQAGGLSTIDNTQIMGEPNII